MVEQTISDFPSAQPPAEIPAVASHGQLLATLSRAGLALARWRYCRTQSIRLVRISPQ